ncbi:MAG: lysostaphin resistance A-like protein [Desulfobaccales bacterium]
MNWHNLWFDPASNQLRCGWRVVSFTCLATFFTILLANLMMMMVIMVNPRLPHSKQNFLYSSQLILDVVVIVVCISLGIWALRVFEHLPARTLGLPLRGPWMQSIGIGFSIGAGLITLVLLALKLLGYASVTWSHLSGKAIGMLLLLLLAMLINGMSQVLIFRGYLFQTLLRGIGPLATLFLTSAVFALIHLQNTPQLHLLGLANIFLAGMMFGMLYLRLGTLWLLIGVHAGWNFAQFLFGLPSSGITPPFFTPIMAKLAAIPWLTGGDFGLEGSVGVSVLLLGLIAIVTYSRRGLPLESLWWQWRDLSKTLAPSPPWDFTVDGRYYQWKLLGREGQE